MPYAYFAAQNGKNGMYFAPSVTSSVTFSTASVPQSYTVSMSGMNTTVSPYYTINNGVPTFFNPSGVQIISSGKDMMFGPGGTLPPANAYGYDDVSNISKTVLGGGVN
jgi:hypothetical protein